MSSTKHAQTAGKSDEGEIKKGGCVGKETALSVQGYHNTSLVYSRSHFTVFVNSSILQCHPKTVYNQETQQEPAPCCDSLITVDRSLL